MADAAKRAAAEAALALVEGGMKLGLGTGSTAKILVDLLAARARAEGLELLCVPTSSRTRDQAAGLGLRIADLDAAGELDLVIDGADEVDPALNLIKGGGGALLQEKIVAAAARRMVVIADASKEVAVLGAFDLPVEVVRFGWETTGRAVSRLLAGADVGATGWTRRMAGAEPFVTDEGHYILDLALGRIGDPAGLNAGLNVIPGVVETGLFTGMASEVLVGLDDGSVRRLVR